MTLRVGDAAPDFKLLTSIGEEVAIRSLSELLDGRRALVLVTYALDFTGG